ncbi:unnamed protein product [Anisakis simplex]|uniref:Voltage-dependent T-type calcium channel subunit alpha n=1 Tax=Anisakis simplex TaxID=6269 RepID=A0A0M3K377_ANISI|nr:unnamed protein product [Anisakis simplex]
MAINVTDVSLTRYYIPEDTSLEYICSQSDSSGLHTCNKLPPYKHNGIKCNLTLFEWEKVNDESCINWNIYYNECTVMHRNPFQGSVSFDNIGFAWVAIFLVISLEGWTDIMYYVQDAHSFWNWIYFVLLIVVGAFFMINLCLVVIATQFAETKRRETERMIQERKRMRSAAGSEQGATSSKDGGAGDSVYAAMVRFIGHHSRRLKRRLIKQIRILRERFFTKQQQLNGNENNNNNNNDKLIVNKNLELNAAEENDANYTKDIEMAIERDERECHIELLTGRYLLCLIDIEETTTSAAGVSLAQNNKSASVRGCTKRRSTLGWLRERIQAFVVCNHFKRGILFAILINTLSMGVEYHQQPELLTIILEYSNYFFTGLFAFEMLLKVIADGLFGYLSDGFNLFDGGIVALSVLELFQEGKGGLSVLRTFRLLRILKLVRFMPALRYQLVVMLRTMDNVTVFFGLLVLFIFIFSILGMNLFGCKFCKVDDNPFGAGHLKKCERKNFDSLLWALITVFQLECWLVDLFVFSTLGMVLFGCKFCTDSSNGQRCNPVKQSSSMWQAGYRHGHWHDSEASWTHETSWYYGGEDGESLFKRNDTQTLEDSKGGELDAMNTNVLVAGTCECERTNFDSFLHASVTVFQILTQEDWNMVLFNGMAQTTPWAALYFVALMTFGNYVLFNLLVAILVEGFQESKEEEKRQLEEEARKKATEEEEERKRELELLLAKTSSPSFILSRKSDTKQCTCGYSPVSQLSNAERHHISVYPFISSNIAKLCEVDASSSKFYSPKEGGLGLGYAQLDATESVGSSNGCYRGADTGTGNGQPDDEHSTYDRFRALVRADAAVSDERGEQHDAVSPTCRSTIRFNAIRQDDGGTASESENDDERSVLRNKYRLNRHTSLVLPRLSASSVGSTGYEYCAGLRGASRQRMNSWCGLHAMFNPYCPVHGRQALIEAYARDKFIQASQELQKAIAEEERREEKRQNSAWRRLYRKTCMYRRADYSLYVFSTKNGIRLRCLKLTQKKWFDYTILFFIGINCITLAMERPSIPPKSLERQFLTMSGYVFTVIFTIEMSLKVVANGCLIGQGAYFKDGWNILDGTLVIISLINVAFELLVHIGNSPKIFGVIRVLRLLRALRPLRVINRAPGVKLVVMTLISSLKPIGNIVLICCTFFIIFGILGVQLFKGMMYHCIGHNISNVTTKAECLRDPHNKWVNHRYNFDNLGQALMSLFVLSSKDGWVSIMYQGIDATGVDMQPIENYNEWRMIYFISFLLLVGFFVLNMFVGVVVENFHKCKEALEAEMRERARQKRLERKLRRQRYEDQYGHKRKKKEKSHPYWYKYGQTRMFLNNIVTSKYFDLAIAAVIGINVISMAMEFYMMPAGLKYVLKALNYFFTAVFTLEAATKLIALGIKRFFKERWNQLDMFIVVLSIAGIIFEEFEALELPINPTIIRVMRVLRIARVLKLLKMAKGIRSLLDTVGEALPQVGNLGSLFFLLFFIFAALGVELFGKLGKLLHGYY